MPWVLTIQGGSLHGAQFRFEASTRLTVGRGADCDVRFHPTADRVVSTLLIAHLAGAFFFVLYLVVWVPLFLAFLGGIVYLVVREGRIVRRLLTPEVGRLITEAELRVAGSFWGRVRWLLASLGRPQRLQARRRFLRALTKLAFCYWHVERAQAAGAQTMSLPRIPHLYEEVRRLRGQVGT